MSQSGAGYIPMVTDEELQRIRRWHDSAYELTRSEAGSGREFTYLGTSLVVPPQVQPINGMSHLLGKAVVSEVLDGDRVLDMGTGSGVNAILAASKSADVVAVDINPHAVAAARHNAELNGVADRVQVRRSDVFSDAGGTDVPHVVIIG